MNKDRGDRGAESTSEISPSLQLLQSIMYAQWMWVGSGYQVIIVYMICGSMM